ncbi:MAG TPA: NAD-glutamate dehydrogenase domain-containing protein, partial [Roseiflexaceae bacterium]|nr:NAD-glutamate dehydrogenase domain-containing protein [Roseiflexaceae bacterium]
MQPQTRPIVHVEVETCARLLEQRCPELDASERAGIAAALEQVLEQLRNGGIEPHELAARLAQTTRHWGDELRRQVVRYAGEERGARLYARYAQAFSGAYQADYEPATAVLDIERLEASLAAGRPLLALSETDDPCRYRLKIFNRQPLALSDTLPVLENLGARVLEEAPYNQRFPDGGSGWITDIGLHLPAPGLLDGEARRRAFCEGFVAVYDGRAENDSLNRLVLLAGLEWREVVLLRAYARYLKQAGVAFSQRGIADCLAAHPAIAAGLVALFRALFDPERADTAAAQSLRAAAAGAIAAVPGLDDERILDALLTVIDATRRCNFFQTDAAGQPKPYVSFKLESGRIPFLPQPVPMFEIFVYSPRVEAVHLRGGKVARGGLRWSDRREDFRTEVLGLVKA